jgi:histidinol-phosphate aminotransferase
MLKLDAMENPHRLPPDLQAHLGQRLGALALNRYPGEPRERPARGAGRYAGLPEGFA